MDMERMPAFLPKGAKVLLAAILAFALALPVPALAAEGALAYAHSEWKTNGSVTLTVSWDDAVCNTPAAFHCEASGMDDAFRFRLDSVCRYDSSGAPNPIVDPTKLGGFQTSPDFSFTFITPGKYRLTFQTLGSKRDPATGTNAVPEGYIAGCSGLDIDVVVSGDASVTVEKKADEVAAECKRQGFTTDYEKALWLHDWVIDNTKYSYLYSTAEGALLRGEGSCEAYHAGYAMLLQRLGIESRRIGYGAPDMHAWTMAKLDGKWYHIDATWDDVDHGFGDLSREDLRHLYFGVTDEIIGVAHVNHTAPVAGYECGSLDDNYLVKTGKAKALADAYVAELQAQLKAGKTSFKLVAKNAGQETKIKDVVNPIVAHDLTGRAWTGKDGKKLSGVKVAYADGAFAVTAPAPSSGGTAQPSKPSSSSGGTAAKPSTPKPVTAPSVAYATHVQNLGWRPEVRNGARGGTAGRGLRVEAFRVRLATQPYPGGIQVSSHVQNIGWQGWVSNGATSGTSGRGLRVEALKVRLIGEMANRYDVYYKTHVQNVGDTGWAKNGQPCGSAGHGWRMEAVYIKLVPKGSAAPGSTANSYVHPWVSYSTHVQNIGWQGWKNDGAGAGTTGRSLRVEAFKVKLVEQPYAGGIEVSSHVQNIGWQGWRANGAVSGTSGRGLRVEALKVRLTGEMAKHYDVYYRTHCQNVGWTGWAKNGASSGTAGYGYRMEAVQIKLIPKGAAAPGTTAGAFRQR